MTLHSSDVEQGDVVRIVTSLGLDVQRFADKTILLAGGSGFLGRHFVSVFRHLNKAVLDRPCTVISADNFITSQQPVTNGRADHDPNIVDVWADVAFPLPIRHEVNFIIHAAGVASPTYYMKYPLETIESAVQGTKNLLELARKSHNLEGFLFFSSSEIYGDPDLKAIPTPETYHGYVSSVGPRACYDKSKRLGETISTIYQQYYKVPATIVRPFNVFGPGMRHDDGRAIPMFTFEALNGRAIPVHGDGRQTRTFCYITDAIAGFLRVLLHGQPGEAYNIGNSDNEIAIADLARLYGLVVPGSTFQLISYPSNYPPGEPQRRCPDLAKAARDLGYAPQIDLKEGLVRFVAWAREQEGYRDKHHAETNKQRPPS